MEKLKVGDKVVLIRSHFSVTYTFSEVERITSTLAILKNGVRVKNTPTKRYGAEKYFFYEFGGSGIVSWELVTPEIIAKYELQQHQNKISSWFSQQKFTGEQKEQIFNLFNEQK